MKKVSIIIPAYNEENNLPLLIPKVIKSLKTIQRLLGLSYEIIIVDDGSTDNTAKIVKDLQKQHKDISYYYQKNKGKTFAVKKGVSLATGDIILIQDADLEYDPNDYINLIQPILRGKAKVVYGNRFARKSNTWLLHSFLANKVLTWTTNLLTGQQVGDMETCYKVFEANLAKKIYSKITSPRFGLEPEVTMHIANLKEQIINVPISYKARTEEQGKKIHVGDFFQALWTLFIVKIKKKYLPMPLPVDLITYTIFGGIAVSVDILLFLILFLIFKTPYVNIVSYTIGTIVSFSLNANYNFNVKNQLTKRYAKFWLISLFGATWSSWLIKILINKLLIPAGIAKVLTMPIVLLYQYLFSKAIVYKK